MKSTFRIRHQAGGRFFFARVALNVEPDAEAVTIEDALPNHPDATAGEVNARTGTSWVAAAKEGIRVAIDYARTRGLLPNGLKIRLTNITGTLIDTRDDVVRCAAAMAAWQGIGRIEPGPEPKFDGHQWVLVFPENVRHPASGNTS